MTGKYIRQVRSAILEELNKPYVEGARARSLKESKILIFYVLPNALTTLLTLMALSMGSLLGGTAAVEMIFSLPGMGYMITNAVTNRDYPVIQAFVVWMSLIYIVINLVTDIVCYYLDPRLGSEMGVGR
jgi:peptide/nickel transport system permease protein